MKKTILSLCLMTAVLSSQAQNYNSFLTTGRGFTEVTSVSGIEATPDNYYILCSAENTGLIVGVGTYESKPGWASENSKALRYISAATDPVLNLSNFFTIEKSGNFIGFRNVVYNSDLFQTHDNAGFMYVNTFTDKNLDEWSYLTPTYQSGYWIFESGKYPISSGNWACGYLGPWNNNVAAGEPMALNRRNTEGDEAGHYRLFRIAKNDLMTEWGTLWQAASESNMIDATWMITNPSFETGDMRGWTFEARNGENVITEYNDVVVSESYGMTNKDGRFLFNAYQWWCTSMNISQTVTDLPSGEYELSAVVCTWDARTVTFTGNETTVTTNGVNDATGIIASMNISIGNDKRLTISAGSTGQWWVEGYEGETQTFFKLDNVQLKCKGLFLNAVALPLPNDNTTLLQPGYWYYYDIPFGTDYHLIGNINGMVYTTDGNKIISTVTTSPAERQLTLPNGRVYFKTIQSDATLMLCPARETEETSTFKAVALNVDGLPNKVGTIDLNADGPGEDGTKKISKYLASKGYDFIGCSEDFNYNGSLMSELEPIGYQCGTVRRTLSLSGLLGGLPFDTDGLNLLWNTTVSATNESWTRWNDTESTDGNQYVKKGYRHYDLTFQGVTFDVYILHMDAGDTNATWSRHSQWQQLAGAINSADASRPKLVIGDTNSRWTREDITANFMNLLNSGLKASDVWVEFYRNGIYPTTDMGDLYDGSDPENYTNYEIVDKIIYINPTAANTPQLVPLNFRIEQDYTYGNVDGTDDTTPLGDHKPVVVEFKIIKAGNETPAPIVLANDGTDNNTTISNANGVLANVTLSGRTFIKDNHWNTLCLPFSLTSFTGTPLEDAEVRTLATSTFADHTLTLNFSVANSVTAGEPFFVKWTTAATVSDPVFEGVTVANTDAAVIPTEYANFIGSYIPVELEANDKSVLYLSDESTLYYPDEPITVGACRGHFELIGITAGDIETEATVNIVLNFGDESTGIDAIGYSPSTIDHSADVWYDLCGRRFNAKPTVKGIYIHQGKKITIQ